MNHSAGYRNHKEDYSTINTSVNVIEGYLRYSTNKMEVRYNPFSMGTPEAIACAVDPRRLCVPTGKSKL